MKEERRKVGSKEYGKEEGVGTLYMCSFRSAFHILTYVESYVVSGKYYCYVVSINISPFYRRRN